MSLSLSQYRKLGITAVPYINATKVASLIGRNKFESKQAAFLDFLRSAHQQFSPLTSHKCPNDTWQDYIRTHQKKKSLSERFENTLKGVTSLSPLSDDSAQQAEQVKLGSTLKSLVDSQTILASRATNDSEVACIVKETEAKVSTLAHSMASIAQNNDSNAALQVLKEGNDLQHIQEATEILDKLAKDANSFVKDTIEASTKSIAMSRGTLLEESGINKMESELKKRKITQRNSKMRYIREAAFAIGGKIDGYDEDEDVVIEVKNRMRKGNFTTPYDSEIVQVRLYMQMMRLEGRECDAAVIREVYPDGTTKSTRVDWSEEEWLSIRADLLDFCQEYADLDSEKVDALLALEME